jgi:hypothetical protein
MKPLLAVSCFVLIVLSTAFVVNADIAKPKPEHTKIFSSLEIVPDPKANNATLQIHQSDLNALRAAIDGQPANTTLATSISRSGPRTIVAGVLLFLSLSFAGVWLARASRSGATLNRGQKTVAVLLVTAATIGAAAIITRGNAGPPPAYRWKNLPTALATGESTAGPVMIEVIPDDPNTGTGMVLTIPLKKKNAKGDDE